MYGGECVTVLAVAMLAFLLAATALSTMPWTAGWVRAFDFPRMQFVGLACVALATVLLSGPEPAWAWGSTLAATTVIGGQAYWILPYTRLWPTAARAAAPAETHAFSIFVGNVYIHNRAPDPYVDQIREIDADIVALVEIDDMWLKALSTLEDRYPHRVSRPRDNAYGMVAWSKLPLEDTAVREVVQENVSSIAATVRLDAGSAVRLFVVHPRPPIPALPHSPSANRDAEMILTGLEAAKHPLPAIIAGDCNDAGWSRSTRRFLRMSGLVDPRIGRGIMSSFHARRPLLRFPLDHLFHDPAIGLVDMRRLEPRGSDHFPLLYRLSLPAGSPGRAHEERAPTDTDMAEAAELVMPVEADGPATPPPDDPL